MVCEFANEVIRPRAIDTDVHAKFPADILEEMGKLGLMGIPFPEEYGGSNGDTISYVIAAEEIARVCGSTGLSYAANVSLGASPLNDFGTDEQKEAFLKPIAQGKVLGAFGLTEPNAGSDAGGTKTTATEDQDSYIINGEKCFITNANFAETLIITAVTGQDTSGKSKITAFIVPTDTPGISITDPYEKMGVRGSDTAEIVLDNVRIPKENIFSKHNKGFKQLLHTLDGGRISIAALGRSEERRVGE